MKKLVKKVQRDITVEVCDICGSEEIEITWDAFCSYSSDGSWDDSNVYHFCSFGHLLNFVKQEFSEPHIVTGKEKEAALEAEEVR